MSRDESIVDDTSSVGNKEDDEDDEEDGNDDEKFEGISGDPERLKAFNVSVNSASCYHPLSLNNDNIHPNMSPSPSSKLPLTRLEGKKNSFLWDYFC